MSAALAWLLLGLALIIVELMTGTFVLLMFGIAAIVAAAAAWAGLSFSLQTGIASVALVISSFVVNAVARRRRAAARARGGNGPMDVGQTAKFEAWVSEPGRLARVSYRDAPWEAVVEGEDSPTRGALLRIVAVEGNRLRVVTGRL